MGLLLKNKTLKHKTLKHKTLKNNKGGGIVRNIIKGANTFILKKFFLSYIKKKIIIEDKNNDIVNSIIDKRVDELSNKLLEYELRATERVLYIIPVIGNITAIGSTIGTSIMGALKIKKSIFETTKEIQKTITYTPESNSEIESPEIIKKGGGIALEIENVNEMLKKRGGNRNTSLPKLNIVNRTNLSINTFLQNNNYK